MPASATQLGAARRGVAGRRSWLNAATERLEGRRAAEGPQHDGLVRRAAGKAPFEDRPPTTRLLSQIKAELRTHPTVKTRMGQRSGERRQFVADYAIGALETACQLRRVAAAQLMIDATD